jgi:pentose-5-phosphate-3-epimerase
MNRRLQRKTLPAPLDDSIDMLGPIVQHTWIDICTVWPDNRAQIFIYSGLPEQVQITQWAKEGPQQDRLEVDGAFGAVIEFHL